MNRLPDGIALISGAKNLYLHFHTSNSTSAWLSFFLSISSPGFSSYLTVVKQKVTSLCVQGEWQEEY